MVGREPVEELAVDRVDDALEAVHVRRRAFAEVGSLRVFMAMLRKKLQAGSAAQPYIQTHIGIGYRMLRQEKSPEDTL